MDTVLKISGNFGIWQLRTILIIFLCKIPASWFMACIIYTAPEPRQGEFYCLENVNKSNQCEYYNKTLNKYDECTNFEHKADFYSLVMQFDLVCSRDIFVAWTQFWHLFGILVGGVVATKLMEWIRPKRVFLLGIVTQIVCGCLTGEMKDFILHCFFRCASAVCCSIMMTSGQRIFTEITGGIFKTSAICLYDTFWAIGELMLPSLAEKFSSWTYIYYGISLPTVVLLVFYYWIPEAPVWLLKQGKVKEVEEILINAANINERQHNVTSNLKEDLEKDSLILKTAEESNWLSLWKGPRAKINFIAAHIALAVYITNFMGMILNPRSFGRDYLDVNLQITGLEEIAGCLLAVYLARKYSDKKWYISGAFNIVAGLIGCLGWTFTHSFDEFTRECLWMLISAMIKIGISLSQSLLLACLGELVPQPKKQIFIFSCVTWARIWLLSAPFINVFRKVDTAMSLTAFGIINAVGGIAQLFLKKPKVIEAIDITNIDKMNNLNNLKGIWNVGNDIEISNL